MGDDVVGQRSSVLSTIQHSHCAHNQLLGRYACDECRTCPPIQSQRAHHRLHSLTHTSHKGVLKLLCRSVRLGHILACGVNLSDCGLHSGPREVAQKPYHNGCQQDGCTYLADILCTLIPHMLQRRTQGGPAVGRKFHNKGSLVLLELHDIKGVTRMVMSLLLRLSMVRAAIMAGTLQPKPIMSGMNDLPCRPIRCIRRSIMNAARAI